MTKFEKRPSSLLEKAEEKKRRMFGSDGNLKQVFEVEVAKAHSNPNQPRKYFDAERLGELALTRSKGWAHLSGVGHHPLFEETREVLESGTRFSFTFTRPPKRALAD